MMNYFLLFVSLIVALLQTSASLENVRPAAIRASGKVSVNVADLLSMQNKSPLQTPARIVVGRYERAMGDAPVRGAGYNDKPFGQVDVKVAGQKIDSASLSMTPPNPSPESNRKLRRILGPDFDPNWMSINAPSSVADQTPPLGYPKTDDNLLKALDSLDLNTNLDHHTSSLLKDWLLKRATCPIEFVWENLGPTFWPQYIRYGHCKTGHSCSWPSGMSCRQSGSRKLRMLRWVCQDKDSLKIPSAAEVRRYRRQLNPEQSRPIRRHRRGGFDPERRQRIVTRLVRSLSYQKDGYFCQWTHHEQIVSDQCTCSCA